MIIVSGWIHVDPGVREGYLVGCRRIVEQARTAPGCLDFALSADLVEPGRINVYERWESDAALEDFRGAEPEFDQADAIRNAHVRKHRVSAVEPA
jgi:quinol monooxygenase YgiN